MESNSLSKYTVSFGLSLALSSVVNALLVVAKKSPAVVAIMKGISGHHWVTHSGIVVLLFLLAGWLFSLPNGGRGLRISADRLLGIVAAGVAAGGLIIFAFYLMAD